MTFRSAFSLLGVAILLVSCAPKEPPAGPEASGLTAPPAEAERWADETLAGLSLEQKIGQMICEQMRGDYKAVDDPEFVRLLALIRDHGIGGFVVYGGTPHDTARLLNRLQKESVLPLLFSSDFEGGPGQQFKGASEFPGNMALSAIDSEETAYAEGKTGALEGRAIGIHLTYSPVVDVQTRPDNPVLGVRSFGADIERLGRLAGAYIRGYQENGMLATAKHFPGRGDVRLIPGTEFTVNDKPAAEVEAQDFAAFKKAIDAGVAFVMSEHIAVPSVTDGSDLPASVEPRLATGWIRDKLGFQGVLTTDDMWYKKITDRFGPVQACVLAVKAGHDAVLKPADAAATIAGLVEAVRSGEIPEKQIDASVRKLLYWKARLNLHRNRFVAEDKISSVVGIREHEDLVRDIADRSLTLLVNRGVFPMAAPKPGRIVHISVQRKANDAAPAAVAARIAAAFPGTASFALGPSVRDEVYDKALAAARGADTVLLSLFSQRTAYVDNGPLPDKDLRFLRTLTAAKPGSVIVMSYGNPYLAGSPGDAAAFLVGYGEGGFYGNQLVYADSLIRLIKGEIKPQGKLPVMVSGEFPAGSGITY